MLSCGTSVEYSFSTIPGSLYLANNVLAKTSAFDTASKAHSPASVFKLGMLDWTFWLECVISEVLRHQALLPRFTSASSRLARTSASCFSSIMPRLQAASAAACDPGDCVAIFFATRHKTLSVTHGGAFLCSVIVFLVCKHPFVRGSRVLVYTRCRLQCCPKWPPSPTAAARPAIGSSLQNNTATRYVSN